MFDSNGNRNVEDNNLQRHSEHGQDWICCISCGASWSVVICEAKGYLHEDTEQLDDGDETCSEHDPENHLRRLNQDTGEWE